ncbi:uncharacterized protein [Takifugu rubripes]|uniref:Uncharacterized LOC115253263 n=1 Tax=Takifugu rubripes TaxID=31033 RepID=A0A674NMD7_TAKRU|nr:uncharacterized protein LOC115253263 [Takifugu rubripes]
MDTQKANCHPECHLYSVAKRTTWLECLEICDLVDFYPLSSYIAVNFVVLLLCVFTGETPETSSSSAVASPEPPLFPESISPRSSSLTSSNYGQSPNIDWVDSFEIPWHKLPEQLTQSLERGKRPTPGMRREMIRIVVAEMMQKHSLITKRSTTEVAKKMLAKYPKSLQDIIEGDVIGPGYHSLVKQLQNRVENVRRSTAPKIRKRKHFTDESDTDEVSPEKRAAIQDTYGCIKWDLKFLPLGGTAESQLQQKKKLKMMSLQTDANPEEVKLLMKQTFYTQWKQVNRGGNIKHLLGEWPYLFDELGMAVHFEELTGVQLKAVFLRNLDVKGNRLLHYMKTVCVNKSGKFLQAVTKYQIMRRPKWLLSRPCGHGVAAVSLLQ